MAQAIQKLEEEECRGEQYECRYIIAEGSILGVAVVLGLDSAVQEAPGTYLMVELTTSRPNSHPGESFLL